MKNFLPVGSVVMLKGGKKRVMICGRVQAESETGKLYDYSACLFPEGVIDPDELYLFNNEDIDTVYFLGLQDVEEFQFRDFMDNELEKMKKEAEEK